METIDLPFNFGSRVVHERSKRVGIVLGYDARVALRLELRWEKTGLKDYLPAAEFSSLVLGSPNKQTSDSGWISVSPQEAAISRRRNF
jgi:hypothetical protein